MLNQHFFYSWILFRYYQSCFFFFLIPLIQVNLAIFISLFFDHKPDNPKKLPINWNYWHFYASANTHTFFYFFVSNFWRWNNILIEQFRLLRIDQLLSKDERINQDFYPGYIILFFFLFFVWEENWIKCLKWFSRGVRQRSKPRSKEILSRGHALYLEKSPSSVW